MECHACADTSFDHCLDAKRGVGPIADAGVSRFLENLRAVFGARFLRYLALTYFGLKGIAFALLTSAMLPYFQLLGISGTGFQLASVVARIPWSMKGFVGVLSDCLPLGRYHKRGYLMLASLIGMLGFGGLCTWPLDAIRPSAAWSIAGLFCCGNVLIATFDLLCEGKYSELMREERAGAEVLTMVWSCMQSGALVGALIVGYFINDAGPQPLLAACLPFAVLAFWRTAAGDLPEEPARSWASLRNKVRSEPELFLLAAAMAVGGLIVAASVALLERLPQALVAIGTSLVLIVCAFRALPRTLARSNLYMFLASVAYMDLTGPLSYFYTGQRGCIVDGPHFSYSYYLAVSNVVGSVGAVLGSVLFQYMQSWTFRQAFCVTACIQVFASAFDLLIVYRLNIDVGLSDQATYLFGDAACQSMAGMMATMPMAMLTARLCPRGAEATVFAILAGFQNFGSSVGSILGVQLTEAFGIQASFAGPCNFERLGTLIVLCHGIGPLCVLPLTWWLVPSARMDDEEVFEAVSPVPSFRSPPASPPSSPDISPLKGPLEFGAGEYCLMENIQDQDLGALRRQFS